MPFSVLIDTNLFVSYLLTAPERQTTITRVFRSVLGGNMQWVVPAEQLEELAPLRFRANLAGRISDEMWATFADRVRARAVLVPRQQQRVPRVARNHNDDYLIAVALREDVDVIISGDKDLLVLRDHLERPRIMSPADFVAEFGTE
jgi:putative PIN family toxin of toxin-antitoxin system